MGNILNKIISNNALFAGVIIGLCIVLVILILLIIRAVRENKKINIYEEELEDEDIKKVKNVKKDDIIDSPDVKEEKEEKHELVIEEPEEDLEEILESMPEEEINQRYEEEKEKEIEEIKEENTGSEIEELISRMEQDSKMKPEDVVANFEKEQEAQSIISYKELVNAVRNRQEEIYEDELESRPLTTVTDCMKAREIDSNEPEEIEELIPTDEEIEEQKTKFKKTDFISPVFGRVEEVKEIKNNDISSDSNKVKNKMEKVVHEDLNDETIALSDINLSDSKFKSESKYNDAAITALDEIYNHMAADLLKNNEELGETASLEELTKNEEFLQSLKDFRKKL